MLHQGEGCSWSMALAACSPRSPVRPAAASAAVVASDADSSVATFISRRNFVLSRDFRGICVPPRSGREPTRGFSEARMRARAFSLPCWPASWSRLPTDRLAAKRPGRQMTALRNKLAPARVEHYRSTGYGSSTSRESQHDIDRAVLGSIVTINPLCHHSNYAV